MTGERRIAAPREKLSDTEMTAIASVKIGPIAARFTGRVTLTDIAPPNGYRISGEDQRGVVLAEARERLHKSCSRLVWLNPLLRWDGFAPKSQGIRAMLAHGNEFRPIHNLASPRALVQSLSRPASPRDMDRWRMAS